MKKQISFNLRRSVDVGRADFAVKFYDDSIVISNGTTGESKTFEVVDGTTSYAAFKSAFEAYMETVVWDSVEGKNWALQQEIQAQYIADKLSLNDKLEQSIEDFFNFAP